MAVNNNSKMEYISSLIYSHRKESGLSQKQLADLAGVGKTVVFDLEKGKQTVRFDTLLRVLKALNISIQLKSPLIKNNEATL